jgi:hypothetical protein
VIRKLRLFGLLLAVLALGALPAVSQANHGKHKGAGKGHHSKCTVKRGFTVRGTLVSFTADDPATAADEESVDITVTGANRHARRSGEIPDQDAAKPGVQVKGAPYSVSGDPFKYKLVGYQGTDTPSAGDKVKIVGKITYTKKRCAPEGTSLEDRYGDPNIRRVKIKDADPD